MAGQKGLPRRSFLVGSGLGAAALLAGGASQFMTAGAAWAAPAGELHQAALAKGLRYGSSAATWQVQSDSAYAALFARESGMLLTEDDLLWYRLKPTQDSPLDFTYGDRIVSYAAGNAQPVLAAHLVWDEGLGDGWEPDALYDLGTQEARDLLFGTIQQEVAHYAGQVTAWVVANEVTDGRRKDANGFWTEEPWYQTIGPAYVEEAFALAHQHDPDAVLLINEFGFETGPDAIARRRSMLKAIDHLKSRNVPVHALGIQAHLNADGFAREFDTAAYRTFLSDVAARGLSVFITEMDVQDDGLEADIPSRDAAVADVYARYLSVALQEPAVKVVLNFGLSDRYTWLEEDFPRPDGVARRPLPFDEDLQPKPAYTAILRAFENAPARPPL
ncbi:MULTISPECIES: endo-1,4-beta-xylanase [unclassified Nonomuraea]|uniref:endo-1,4-beta-xylanase n=1 Tax=unclassified Nonomuraea TaxID=2593643 RepID=UPI0013779E34|nr:endo-1,4-beta-xylanase [Nonomuraea sp. KC401]NBE93888.1 glycosyl hydrolase family 10 [Nonomuraea sp. K271]